LVTGNYFREVNFALQQRGSYRAVDKVLPRERIRRLLASLKSKNRTHFL